MKSIKMIAADLDGTLLRDDKTVSGYTRRVLNRCLEKGIILIIATGRPERGAKKAAPEGLASYIIADNGATVTSAESNQELHVTEIPEAVKNSLIARLAVMPGVGMMTAETGRKLYTNIPGDDYMTAGWNTLFWDFIKPVPDAVRKISAECGDREAMMAVMRDYPELRLYPNKGEDWYQITHKSASKYSGIAYLTGITGIDTKDVIAFGDDFNDIEMLENCGAGVAMENAGTEVKRAARFVCGSNEDDGLAKFLDKHILGEQNV